MAREALYEYKQRRNFGNTPEPTGEESFHTQQEESIFVIQKHTHTRDKHILRLESHGILKSWEIPDGIAQNPENELLARRVENHPLSYSNFEDKIPHGEYNQGKITIVDKGFYKNIKEATRKTIQKDLKEGKIQIRLEGDKIQGNFELKKFQLSEEKWLFKKLQD